MLSSLDKLEKFLSLEIKRNYDNRAVLGGLEKTLPVWLQEATADGISSQTIQSIADLIRHYDKVDTAGRNKVVQEILELIQSNRPNKRKMPTRSSSSPSVAPSDASSQSQPVSQDLDEALYNKMLLAPVTTINGIGESMAKKLAQLEIFTVRDLLNNFPRRYDDFSNLKPINRLEYGEEVTAIGTIKSIATRPTKNPKLSITEAVLTDGTGYLRLSWFNRHFLENAIRPEMQVVVSGKVDRYLGRLSLNNPEWEKLEKEQLHTNRIVPVYSLVADLKQRTLRNVMYKSVSYWSSRLFDYMPEAIIQDAQLMDLPTANAQIHFPDSLENLKRAQERLAFDEIFLLQIGALQQKKKWQSGQAEIFPVTDLWLDEQEAKLPFPLTGAQKKSLDEIRADVSSGIPMIRLLQGDVGSGKTIVAALASTMILEKPTQVAILSPTSILAEQHFRTFKSIFSKSNGEILKLLDEESIRLLIGSTPEAERAEILSGLIDGTVKIIIGTHALLEEPVQFANLQLAVIDEQHRFGVKQRATLREKGNNPHLLVMTATPIPRSLALTIYGDLDLSIIDEMPSGRQPIETHVLYPLERERAYSLISSQVQSGYQAFIVYPLVEEGENEGTPAAVSEFERLKAEVFLHERIGLVHGRLRQEEKDQVMEAFRDRKLDILVATSVVEVGVDIPNATVMLVEGANRFGLAQLHQFRGRVGRGKAKSYCLLIPETEDAVENERLVAMGTTNDGFILAEKDLAQRGPGEFFGLRQSGYSNLKIASLSNIKLIEQARRYALEIFHTDPDLELPQHKFIKPLIQYHWNEGQGEIS